MTAEEELRARLEELDRAVERNMVTVAKLNGALELISAQADEANRLKHEAAFEREAIDRERQEILSRLGGGA